VTRGATTTAIILALLTGIVLGQIGMLAGRPGVSRPAASNASPQALASARSFYVAIDRLLDSGDRSIESTVAPGFVDHPLSGQEDRTLQEMIDELLALRATLPHLRVTVLDLEQRDQLIAVRLEIDPGEPSPIPGLPLMSSPPRQVFEFLRVEGAGVTERWNAAGQLPVAAFSISTDDRWDNAASAVPAIERVVLDPGRSMHLPYAGKIILWTESGSVRLDRAGVDLEGNRRSTQDSLDAGQVRILEGGNPLALRNVSNERAELWVVSADISRKEQQASGDATVEPSQPLTVAFIPLQISSDVRGTPRRLSVTLLTLPPGSTVTPHTPGIVEEIAVLSGVLEVTVDRGRALISTDGKTAHPFDGTVTLTDGSGVSANEMASLGYRVAGSQPAALLVMHIEASPTLPATTP
jgi:quercetin dioxygenase-like cupin family protein